MKQGLGGTAGEVGALEGCGQKADPDPGAHKAPSGGYCKDRRGGGGVRAGAGDQRGGGDCTGSAQEEAEKQGKDDSRVFSLVTLKVGAANS